MSTSLVLVINCGSSSIKFAVIDPQFGDEVLTGQAERLFSEGAEIAFKQNGEKTRVSLPNAGHDEALVAVVEFIQQQPGLGESIKAVGHRVVHGGEFFRESMLITDEVADKIGQCNHLAPLHNPANLAGIETARKVFPDLPHTAVFDTAFHQSMPAKSYIYPLPYKLYEENAVRRYGFHGTSYRYVCVQAATMLKRPLEDSAMVIAHLGNGASVCAVKNGESMETSMGMTPNEGIVHGTRSGSIDPSIHEYLAKQLDMNIDQINDMLWKESGLLGISGLSNDCRTIEEAAEEGHERSQLALEIYSYRLARTIASMVPALGRLDGVVFTGGIGENSDVIRAETLRQLQFLGIDVDAARNKATIRGGSGEITTDASPVKALVVPTNEELMIAQDAVRFVEAAQPVGAE
ncbi:acetate kinase [Oceanobacter kriegii]|uniref:acetate kinase n=1 Tax=Oceanobacter kriegii TaxID=64972 RepID=UPI00041E48F7|nr:acetate kinase [Oceanobacter kriegii]